MKPSNFFNERLTRQAPDGIVPPPASDPPPATEQVAAQPDFSFIPTDFHKDGSPALAAFTAHYQDIVARDAQAAERAGQIPETYEFATSPDLKFEGIDLPEGFTVELQKDDPAMAPLYEELGTFLKEIGAPAAAGSKVSDLIARYEAVKYSQSYAAHKAEMAALGTPVQQQARLGAIERALQTRLPEAQAKALKSAVMSAAGVQALEALLRPTGHTMPPNQPQGANTDALTPYDRLKYANAKT